MPKATSRSWCAVGALLLSGCGKPPPPVAPDDIGVVTVEDPPAPVEPEPTSSGDLVVDIQGFGEVNIGLSPDAVSDQLAEGWCRGGGDTFRPPVEGGPTEDDDWPPRLESCDDVLGDAETLQHGGGLVATALTIESGSYADEYYVLLLLQSDEHAGLFEIEYRYDMEEVDPIDFELQGSQLRDVMGTTTPELILDTRWSGGDSYEADRCYAHEKDVATRIVCTEGAQGFGCLSLQHRYLDHGTPREDLEECDEAPEELGEGWTNGHSYDLTLEAGMAHLTPRDDHVSDVYWSGATGDIPLATLLEDAALEPLASGRRGLRRSAP